MKGLFKIKTLKSFEELSTESTENVYLKNMLKYTRSDGSYETVERILKIYYKEKGMSSEEIDSLSYNSDSTRF